jgi:hypothetical protein
MTNQTEVARAGKLLADFKMLLINHNGGLGFEKD